MPKVSWGRGKQSLQRGSSRGNKQELEEVLKKHPVLAVFAMIGLAACAWAPSLLFSAFSAPAPTITPPPPMYSAPMPLIAPAQLPPRLPLGYAAPTGSMGMNSPYQHSSQQLQIHAQQLNDLVRSNQAYGNAMRGIAANHGAAVLQAPAPMP